MPRQRHPEFVLNELVGDHLIEETIVDGALREPADGQPSGDVRDPGHTARPPRNDPRHADQSVLPGRPERPAGSERPATTRPS